MDDAQYKPTSPGLADQQRLEAWLFHGTRNEDIDCIKSVVRNGANIESTFDEDNKTPLMVAAELGKVNSVKCLLDLGANANVTHKGGIYKEGRFIMGGDEIALHYAARSGHADVVDLLLPKTEYINAKDSGGRTALHYAVRRGHTAVVDLLIPKAHINAKTNSGLTALHDAAIYGYADVVNLLISKTEYINARDGSGLTALHYAAKYGHVDVVDLLLPKTEYIDAKDGHGNTPLHYAAYGRPSDNGEGQEKYIEIFKSLLRHGADINVVDVTGASPLHFASMYNLEVLRILLGKVDRAEVNRKTTYGDTPLHLAAYHATRQSWSYQDERIKLLLDYGADVMAIDNQGNTVLHKIVHRYNPKMFKTLCLLGVDPYKQNKDGNTPIMTIPAYAGYAEELTQWLEKYHGEIEAARAKRVAEEKSGEEKVGDDTEEVVDDKEEEAANDEKAGDDESNAAEGDNLSLEPAFSIDLSGLFNLGESVVADEVDFPIVIIQHELDIFKDEDGSKGLEAALSEIVQRAEGVEVALPGDLYETGLNNTTVEV